MMRRSRIAERSLARAGWIGMVAILIGVAIAYVAYGALSGLPWESRYRVTVVLPDANRLIAAGDVKVGGVRVGQVSRVTAVPARTGGDVQARVELSLKASVGPLPVDSAFRVRSVSALGATYVEVVPGSARETIPDGGVLTPAATRAAVDLPDLFDVFDRGSRRAFQDAMSELSAGVSGRGVALNTIIGYFSDALPPFTEVARALAAPSTRLGRFLQTEAALVDALVPVRRQLAGLFTSGATTFEALAGERAALGESIALSPGTERSTTAALRAVRPSLDDLARFSEDLRPVAARLPVALRATNSVLAVGTPALRGTRRITRPLRQSLAALSAVARQESPDGAVRKLSDVFDAANHITEALLPAQRQCNLLPVFFQGFASYLGVLGSGAGPAWLNLAFDRPGAQGDGSQSAKAGSDLHVNYLPNENESECEAGNEPFDPNVQVMTNPAGLQSASTRETSPPPNVLELARKAGLLATGKDGP